MAQVNIWVGTYEDSRMKIIKKILRYGFLGCAGIVYARVRRRVLGPYYRRKHKFATVHNPPDSRQLQEIERRIIEEVAIPVRTLDISPKEFNTFKEEFLFPEVYSRSGGLREEKLLEHFIAYKLCGLQDAGYRNDCVYIDVAGGGAPWAEMLRQKGVNAFAIDLNIHPGYRKVDYYRQMDAKNTSFADSSVSVMSLQCAYEMFLRNDDILFIDESNRILKPGGKVIIVPLYMNTMHGGFSSPDYYGKGYADREANEWIRPEMWGIPFAREYDAPALKERIVERVKRQGMECVVHVLRNKELFGKGIYCHFVLEVSKGGGGDGRRK